MTHLRCPAVALALALCGCDSSPRLDTSTDETLMSSIAKMNDGLTAAEREELTKSIATLVAPRLAERTKQSRFEPDSARGSQAELLRPYDGWTARQIIARAKEQAK
jgi:hypothetical protein